MIDVYLFRGKHPLYETLISHPPDGVTYLPRQKPGGAEEYSLYGSSHSMLRQVSDGFFNVLDIPRYVPILRRCDLVHSSRGFIVLGPNPFVVDVEHISSFVGMNHDRLKSERPRKLIAKALRSSRCGRILPHCRAAEMSISLVTNDKTIIDKTSVVYPAVNVGLYPRSRHKSDVPTILFMGEYYWKGGRELLQACSQLAQTQDFKVTYLSLRVHPPPGVVEKARAAFDLEFIRGPVPRKDLLDRIYPATDIFVMPTYIDTFGYAYLEAMACGISCIGTRHFAVPEIIENEATGILVKPPLTYFDEYGRGHPELNVEAADGADTVRELRDSIDRLLSSATLRMRMGAEGLKLVTTGKFSITRRNALLKEAYEECLKG